MEELRKQFEKLVHACENPRCPECGGDEVSHLHYEPDYGTDECDYFQCMYCGFKWGIRNETHSTAIARFSNPR